MNQKSLKTRAYRKEERGRKVTTISEFQEMMKQTYFHRDKKRGVHATLLWMTSELGEMLNAFLKKDRSQIGAEAADVFAWLCSVCNLLNVDLEEVSLDKYGAGCPRCRESPCICEDPATAK